MLFHSWQGNAEPSRDFDIAQLFELCEEENLPRALAKFVEQAIDGDEGFDDDGMRFLRNRFRIGMDGERLKVSVFQCLPTEAVNHKAMRDSRQITARFAQRRNVAIGDDADENILRQIGGIECVAELAAQPSLQPTVMVTVKRLDLLVRNRIGGRHCGERIACK